MAESEAAPTTESNQPQNEAPARGLSLLAKEEFGSLYHGEVKEEPEQPEEGEEPTGEESEEAEPEHEAAEEGGEESDQNDEAEEEPISSLQELIEHQEWDPEWANSLKVQMKVDGKPADTTLGDLINNAQKYEAADKRLEDAKAKAKAQTDELAQKSEALEGQFATVAKLVENAEKLLDTDTQGIDWKELRENDPSEYAAKKAEIAERREEVERLKKEAVETYQSTAKERQQETEQDLKERLQKEQETLLEKVPEWRDEAKAKDEKAQLTKYLMNQGFSEQDVMGASDHRLVVLARKAMLFDEGRKKADAAKKKVAKVPKVMKPGAPKSQDQNNRERMEKAKSKLQSSRNNQDALDAGVALLKAKRGGQQ